MIKSISFSNTEILQNILKLYVRADRFDLDPTFSKGNFYKNILEPTYKSDLIPQRPDIIPADFTKLPFKDNSINSICADPPFVVGLPNKSKDTVGSNLIKNRFGAFRTIKDLKNIYVAAIKEFYRVLKPGGWLVWKCQDTVSSGKQYWSHVDSYNMAIVAGFEAIDLFVLLAKSRMTSSKWRGQYHARKFHSFFWVFKKI
jgi:hypothetical protein